MVFSSTFCTKKNFDAAFKRKKAKWAYFEAVLQILLTLYVLEKKYKVRFCFDRPAFFVVTVYFFWEIKMFIVLLKKKKGTNYATNLYKKEEKNVLFEGYATYPKYD